MQLTIHTATIDHQTGYIDLISLSEPGLRSQIAPYCREKWSRHFDEEEPMPTDEDELINTYFDKTCDAGIGDGEFLRPVEFQLEVPHPHWNPPSHWEDHPDHDDESWRDEVRQGDTRLGYTEWVNHQIESAA